MMKVFRIYYYFLTMFLFMLYIVNCCIDKVIFPRPHIAVSLSSLPCVRLLAPPILYDTICRLPQDFFMVEKKNRLLHDFLALLLLDGARAA